MRSALGRWPPPPYADPAFDPGEAGEVVGEIGQGQLRRGAGLAYGADDEVEAALLGGEDVFDARADAGAAGVATGDVARHGPAPGLGALELGFQAAPLQHLDVGRRPIGGVAGIVSSETSIC